MTLYYKIDNTSIPIEVPEQEYQTGKNVILSNKDTDITFGQKWYDKGYSIEKFLTDQEFSHLHSEISKTIANLINQELKIDTQNFSLKNYHKFVTSTEDHFKIVSKTRDLFPKDFGFDIVELIPKLSEILGFELNDIDPDTKQKLHIIVRINRPGSNDYNPPHKDMYEGYDARNYFPQFVNFWIPIDGVTNKTSLPMVPGSHLIPEDKVLRTTTGGVVGKNKYRVRFIKEWGSNALIRTNVGYSEALVFSSHLIHGLAINEEPDITRVALEFRLFKK